MNKIFISYRREDSEGFARSLFQSLSSHFGKDKVFMDVEAIGLGMDFVEAIEASLAECGALLVLIGKDWVSVADQAGQRRLDDPNDFVRTEVAKAIQRNVRVIPVLVKGAPMPAAETLPEELKSLVRRQALELRHERWDQDVSHLAASLEKALGLLPLARISPAAGSPPVSQAAPDQVKKKRSFKKFAYAGAALIAVLMAWSYLATLEPGTPNPKVMRESPARVTYEAKPTPETTKETPAVREAPAASGPATETRRRSETPRPNTNLSGVWRDDEGVDVEIHHEGMYAVSQSVDPETGDMVQANWTLNGRSFEFTWRSASGGRGYGRGAISSDYNQIQYEYVDLVSGMRDSGRMKRSLR